MAFLIVIASLVVLGVEIAGIARLLGRPLAVFGIVSALSVTALALCVTFRRERSAPFLVATSGASLARQGPGPVLVFDRVASLEGRCLAASVLILLLTWIPLALSRLALPPVAWDALTYHLTFPVTWLHRGDLATTVPAYGDSANTYYPLVGQMLLYWNLVSTGTDRWTVLSQLPFLVAGGLAVAGLASRCGATRRSAALAALVFVATPVALRQSVEVMLDVEQSAMFVLAAFFALRARDGSPGSAILAWVATGLLAGLKYSGAVLVLPLLPLLGVASLGDASGARSGRLLAGSAAALALGAYAYLRNAVTCGNPLMPLHLELGPWTLPGPVGTAAYFGAGAPRLGWSNFLFSPRSVLELGCLLLPSLVLMVFGVLAPSRTPGTGDRRLLAWVGIFAFALSGFLLPFREHRYFLPEIAVACALAPPLLVTAGWRLGMARLVPAILLLQAPVTLAYVLKDVAILGSDAPHAFGFEAGSGYERTRYARWLAYWGSRHEWEDRARARTDLRDMSAAWAWIGERTMNAPAVVAYAGVNTSYPLSGARYRNVVTFVPRAGPPDGTLYAWGKPPYFDASRFDSTAWRSNVIAARVSYLCVFRLETAWGGSGSFPVEDEFARREPARFSLAWASESARIYAVRAP